MKAVSSGLGASCRFAQYFIICGMDPDTGLELQQSAAGFEQNPIQRAFRSKVVAHYPQSPDRGPLNTDAINMLCMPRGLLFRTQSDSLEPHFHSFTCSRDDGTRCYGFVHTYYEEVKNVQITTAMHTLYQMHHVEQHSSSSSASSPSSSSLDSLASSTEEGDAESSCVGCAASYDQDRDTLYVSKALCLLTPLPFLQASRHFLSQLHLAAVSPEAPPLPLESYVHNILYEVPLPPPGRSLRFHGVQGPIMVQRPGPEELPLGDYPLGETCALLGVEGLVQLLTCLLLETQVLLYSQDYQRLMTVAESVNMLLFPFQWQHVYLPILPAALLHLLDAPVPFLLGVQRGEGDTRTSLHLAHEANLCFVDIDHHCVEPPEDLPLFPDQEQLHKELSEVLLRFSHLQHGAPSPASAPAPAPAPAPPCLSGLVLEDMMEDKRNGNLGGEELAVLERLHALASCGVGGATNRGEAAALGRPLEEEEEEELRSAQLNAQLREVFACRFSAMFSKYDEFIIQSASDLESWLSNKEGNSCFDKSSFLSAQPAAHLHFLSSFLETSMFSHFVEGKLMSRWADLDAAHQVFDGRLERERLDNLDDEDPSNRRYRKCTTLHESAQTIERRLLKADHTALHPHLLNMRIGQGRHQPGSFPCLQADVLAQGHNTTRWSGRAAVPCKVNLRRSPITDTSALDNNQREKHTLGRRNLQQSTLLDPSPMAFTQTHRDFVEGLLRECCLKTKRMLVERMGGQGVERIAGQSVERMGGQGVERMGGQGVERMGGQGVERMGGQGVERMGGQGVERMGGQGVERMGGQGVDQGQGEAGIAGLQENTLIHGLCDLLERTWAHGLQLKQGKSALWSHLLHYQACQDKMEPPASSPVCDGVNQGRLEEGLAHRGSCLQDMRFIQSSTCSLSDVGKARAWIQLALEKKMLSPHLKELLANQKLVRQLYKPHAFLLSEEEREQFLFHLLSLNTVDYFCFTRCFTSVSIPYRVVIMPMKKLSIAMTTVTPWVCVSGELGDSGVRHIPRNIQEIYFHCKNLGRLSTLQLGQENSGLLAKCLVDCVLVYNLITGHSYRFPCGRWLGKGVGDGSLERVLIGQLVSPGGEEDAGRVAGTPPELSSPPQSGRVGLGALGGRYRMTSTEVQENLREAVNNLIKHFHKPEQERENLTVLLCGDHGLVLSLEHFLLHGFKSSRLFQRTVFIWDFVEKAVVTMEMDDQMGDLQGSPEVWDSLCRYANAINSSQRNIGKEGKFQLLVCLGLRDRLLARWLPLLAACPLTARMYEEGALLRDSYALHALSRLLHTLQDFSITLETALVKGVEL